MSDLTKPITRSEVYMAAASGNIPEGTPLPEPMTRQHEYLKAIAEAMQSYIDISTVKADIEHLQTDKADKSDVYTKTETDNKIIAKVSEIVADAPEDFDTLKEMSDWIASHENSAAEMNSAIQTNKSNIAELQTGKANTEDVYDKTTADSRFLGVNDTANKSVADENGDNIAEQFTAVKNDIAINRTTLGVQCKNLLNDIKYISSVTSASKGSLNKSGNSINLTATDFDCHTIPYSESTGGYRIIVNPNTKYILSWESDNRNPGYIYVFFNGTVNYKVADNKNTQSLTFTTNSDTTFITIRFGVSNAGDSITYSNIMIRYADITDDTYEPYKPCLQEQIDAIAERLSALEET